MSYRIGCGFDAHRLVPGRPLRLGGVEIPYDRGLEGHSDGDCLFHAVCDALLGAAGAGDMGEHFPSRDERWRGVRSEVFCRETVRLVSERGLRDRERGRDRDRPEHIEDFPGLLGEVARVLKSGGGLEIVVPHFSNPYFYSDPTHKRFFGLYRFCYYASESLFSRKVPTYQHAIQFDLLEVNLGFKSSRPFYVRHGLKKAIGSVFNSCGYMKEFYEENLSQVFPCYEIRYQLQRK